MVNDYKQEGLKNFSISKCYKFMPVLFFINKTDEPLNRRIINYVEVNPSKSIFVPANTDLLFFKLYLIIYYILKLINFIIQD